MVFAILLQNNFQAGLYAALIDEILHGTRRKSIISSRKQTEIIALASAITQLLSRRMYLLAFLLIQTNTCFFFIGFFNLAKNLCVPGIFQGPRHQ